MLRAFLAGICLVGLATAAAAARPDPRPRPSKRPG